MAKILLVEDDPSIVTTVREYLEREQHQLHVLVDGGRVLKHLESETYDILILDWALPGSTGLAISQELRARGDHTPIIMLTGRDGIDDKEMGFEAGIDDYLTKPFSTRELGARIRALGRRPERMIQTIVQLGALELNSCSRRVTNAGAEVHLRPQEFNLLEFLMRHPGEVFSPDVLLERVWHSDSDATRDTVRTHINRLRTKLEVAGEPAIIENVFGVGYKFVLPQEP